MKIIPVNQNIIRPIRGSAKLNSMVQISQYVYELELEMITPEEIDFKPGQYIAIVIDQFTRRQYSISTAPNYSKKVFQLILDIKPNGVGVNYLMKLNVGDIINFIGQIGLFVLPHELRKNLYFISTGTGLGPLKSMMEYLILSGEYESHNIISVFGTRFKEDIFYEDTFSSYMNKGKILESEIYLSREDEFIDWNHGYVTEYIKGNTFDASNSQFFICGSGQMIIDAENLLVEKGVEKGDIFYEKFY